MRDEHHRDEWPTWETLTRLALLLAGATLGALLLPLVWIFVLVVS